MYMYMQLSTASMIIRPTTYLELDSCLMVWWMRLAGEFLWSRV